MHHFLRERTQRLSTFEGRLRLLGPEQVLARGYSITIDELSGKVLREASKVTPGQTLKTRLQSGVIHSVAQESHASP